MLYAEPDAGFPNYFRRARRASYCLHFLRHQINYAGRIPSAKLDLFEGVGHLIFAEAPEEFERGLLQWLEQHG